MFTRILLSATLALLPLSATASAGPAMLLPAHSSVTSTSPADGEVLTAPIEQFTVTANEELTTLGEGDANSMTVQQIGGGYYGDGCAVVDGDTLSMGAYLGTPGSYLLTYQLVSADGHLVSGQLTFEWRPDAGVDLYEGSVDPPVCGAALPPLVQMPIETTSPVEPNASVEVTIEPPADPSATPEAADGAGDFPFWLVAVIALVGVGGVMFWTWYRAQRRDR